MEEEVSTCPICLVPFDHLQKQPHIIPYCGHTLCNDCLQLLVKSHKTILKCPECKSETPLQEKNSLTFPKNYALLRHLEKSCPKELCKDHKTTLDLICNDCQSKVCYKCEHMGNHKKHDIEAFENFAEEINIKLNDLKDWIKKFEKYQYSRQDFLENTQRNLLELIELKFNVLSQLLLAKKAEISRIVQGSFQRLEFITEQIEPSCNESKQIASLIKEKDYLRNLIADWQNTKSLQSAFILKEKNLKKFIEEIQECLEKDYLKSIIDQTKSVCLSHFEDFINKLEEICSINFSSKPSSYYPPIIRQEWRDTDLNEIIKDISISFSEDKTTLSVMPKSNLTIIDKVALSLDSLNTISTLVFQGNNKFIHHQELRHFQILLTKIDKLTNLRIELEESEIEGSSFDIISESLSQMSSLEKLSLDISQAHYSSGINIKRFRKPRSISSESFTILARRICSLNNLKELDLRFSACLMINEDILAEISNSLLSMTQLEKLTLDLDNLTTLGDQGLIYLALILGNLKKLTSLSLYIDYWKITNKSLIILVQEIKRLPKLTHLEVSIEGCNHITNEPVTELIQTISSLELKELFINLKNCSSLSASAVENLKSIILQNPQMQIKIFH